MNFSQSDQDYLHFSKRSQSTTTKEEPIINKISRFLDSRQIGISQFWRSDLNYASPTDLVKFCKNCGLEFSQTDVINLKSELFATKETIKVQTFAEYVAFWNLHQRETIFDFLKKRSDIVIDKIKAREKKRPNSSLTIRKISTDVATKTLPRQTSAHRFRKDVPYSTALTKNNSQDYLKRYKQKQMQRQKQLKDNIQKNKIDEEYAMLLKMSELNTINRERNSKTTYRAYKSAEGVIKVRVFDYNEFRNEISLNQFDSIYKKAKKATKENKDWTFIPQAMLKNLDELQGLKYRNVQKSERQQELKNLLVNTVNLTNLLKEQIKIFKMKGIYGCQNV